MASLGNLSWDDTLKLLAQCNLKELGMDGLYAKYAVYKKEDGSAVNDCFVLRPDRDAAALVALKAYARTTRNRTLAKDIEVWIEDLERRLRRTQVSFGTVLEQLHLGAQAYREGWNGKNMHIKLQKRDKYSKMTRDYIYMCTADSQLVPWVASQTDLLAKDWIVEAMKHENE